MMTRLIKIIFLISVVSFFSCSQKRETDLQKTGLKGNVKSIREITYAAFGTADTLIQGEITDNLSNENTYTVYNPQGFITDVFKYDKNNIIKYKWKFYYDDGGEKQLSGKRYEALDMEEDSTAYVYDKKGNPVEYLYYYADGSLKFKILSKFDKKGNLTEEKQLDEKNLVKQISKFKYSGGNLTEGRSYDKNSALQVKSVYTYDKQGNMLSVTMSDGKNKPISRGEYSYNADGFVQTELLKRQGYTDLLLEYIYTIDSQGNWIQRIMLSDNEAFQITKREIEYY
ncbi:MAG: hypothetical protein IJ748_07160 [Bacteroidales bacterium]|nr:hypothetical protein [Bacteroidales bacterium]